MYEYFLNALKKETNYTYTENGALVHASTLNKVFDMFARAGAMRRANDWDCINLFKEAYEENAELALKCLFWVRDIRAGAGERRYFRVCYNWLAKNDIEAAVRNIEYVPFMGRYDDLFCLVDTPAETAMWDFIRITIVKDMQILMGDTTGKKAISLLGKWLKSINCSSKESVKLGKKTARALGMTARDYRKTLTALRKRINVLETLMSANRWEEIDFSALPSKAGLLYRQAFQKHQPERYKEFMMNKNTKVNSSSALYPYEIVGEVIRKDNYSYWNESYDEIDPVQREALNKYWQCQNDYFNGKSLDALCVIDTSGSMVDANKKDAPINVAISLGLYCAERAQGPFHNHYISFSSRPQLIETSGVDFVDKVQRIYRTDLCENTDIEATFDLILNTIVENNISADAAPKRLIVVSDMQFDSARTGSYYDRIPADTLMDGIRKKWESQTDVPFPALIYWNVNAERPTFPSLGDNISYVSGCSPTLFDAILSNKDGVEMMLEVLGRDRYKDIK